MANPAFRIVSRAQRPLDRADRLGRADARGLVEDDPAMHRPALPARAMRALAADQPLGLCDFQPFGVAGSTRLSKAQRLPLTIPDEKRSSVRVPPTSKPTPV